MKRWARASRLLFCGFCKSREIKQGDPVLFISTANMKREMKRCVDCSGPAPPDLPPLLAQRTPGDFSMVSFGQMKKPATRGDLKKQVREWMPYREPGMEG